MECASIQRVASSIAWCPVSSIPSLKLSASTSCNPIYLLASVHQEMDNSFNSSSQIEILNTSPSCIASANKRNKTHAKTIVPLYGSGISKLNFTTLSWGEQTNPTESMPLGLIAGGMEDGSITLWNPYNLMNGNRSKALMGQYSEYHEHKITAMQFNPSVSGHTFLATCDVGEKLYVWDLTKPESPVAQQPPTGKRRASESMPASMSYPKYGTAVAWNNNVSYILAVSNCLGQTAIYDLRNKKVALTFESKNIDKAQSISWNPNKARQLAVCYVKGEAEIWDLKQPKSPKMYLRDAQFGHTRSILDLSWSKIDHNLLLTSGDDGVANVWNGNNGTLIHQIAFNDNESKLKVEWNNNRGGLLATMDTQRITVYNIGDLGEKYCPSWMNKECGVELGFGGKVVSFGNEYILSTSSSSTNLRNSNENTKQNIKKKLKLPPTISIDYLPKSEAMIARAHQFKKTLDSLSNIEDLRAFIEIKLQSLRALLIQRIPKETPVKAKDDNILSELGLDGLDDTDDDDDDEDDDKEDNNDSRSEIDFEITIWEMISLFFDENDCKEAIIKYLGFEKNELMEKKEDIMEAKQDIQSPPKQLHIETDNDNDDTDDDDFFNNLSSKPVIVTKDPIKSELKTPKEEEEEEDVITKVDKVVSRMNNDVRSAIITGNYELAIDLCLRSGCIADALVFAYYAKDDSLWRNVTARYFSEHKESFIADTFCHIAANDYASLVSCSSLDNWRQTLAILLTFIDSNSELNSLCNVLGERLIANGDSSLCRGAIACFLCSHNISGLISLWTVSESAKPTDLVLNSCITKALIYVNTPFVQQSLSQQPSAYNRGQSALSSIFCKYANLLANQGSMSIASTFLEFIDHKLQKPANVAAADPQIKQLISRIQASQTPQTSQSITNTNTNANTKRQRPMRPKRRPSGAHQSPIATQAKPIGSPSMAPLTQPSMRGPIRGRRPPPKRIPQKRQQPPVRQQQQQQQQTAPPQNVTQTQAQPQTQRQTSMPNRNRGMRSRGSRNAPPSNTSNAPRSMPKASPRNSGSGSGSGAGGMNGHGTDASISNATSMPPRIGRGRGNMRPPPPRSRGGPSSNAQRMPPTSAAAPVSGSNTSSAQAQAQAPVQSSRPRRDRGRGRGQRQQASPTAVSTPQRQRPMQRQRPRSIQNQKQTQNVAHAPQEVSRDEPEQQGYSASATSSGSGYFGQTLLLEDDEMTPLPDNALDTLCSVRTYLSRIESDNAVWSSLSITQQKTMKTQSAKLSKDLNDLISNHKMSYYAYSSLLEIFNSLQSRQYDHAMKQITQFTKSCKSNKQEKFAMHRKWVMAFQSIIRIAKNYNI